MTREGKAMRISDEIRELCDDCCDYYIGKL